MGYLIILGAIPFFLLMMGLEMWALRRQSKPNGFRLNDTITNLNIGCITSSIWIGFWSW